MLGLVRLCDSVRRAQMAHDVMLVSVCVRSGGLGAAELALNLLVQAKLHIDLDRCSRLLPVPGKGTAFRPILPELFAISCVRCT